MHQVWMCPVGVLVLSVRQQGKHASTAHQTPKTERCLVTFVDFFVQKFTDPKSRHYHAAGDPVAAAPCACAPGASRCRGCRDAGFHWGIHDREDIA